VGECCFYDEPALLPVYERFAPSLEALRAANNVWVVV